MDKIIELNELEKKVLDMFENSFTGQVLSYHKVPNGQIISYEKDINIKVMTTDETGEKFEIRDKGDRVFPFTFQIIGTGNTEEEAIQNVITQCDAKVKNILISASILENKPLIYYNDILNWKEVINNFVYKVERHRLLADKIIVGRDKLSSMRKNMNVIDFSPELDKEILLKGIFGQIYGYQIFVDTDLPNIMLTIAGKDMLGAVPFRLVHTFTPEQMDKPEEYEGKKIVVCELGIVILNPRAVAIAVNEDLVDMKLNMDKIIV